MDQFSFLWSTEFTALTLFGYKVSFIELIGTIAGLLSVWFGTRNSILIWHFGFVNVIAFAVIFFQIHLYADMLLQVFYFFATAYGLYNWTKGTADSNLDVTSLRGKNMLSTVIATFLLSVLLLIFTQTFPKIFSGSVNAASFPVYDSILSASSIIATILMARKKIECWLMWIVIDTASVFLYIKKDVFFIAMEYGIFTILAVYGYYKWKTLLTEL